MWWPCSRGLSRGAALQRSSPWRAPVRHLASASIIDGKAIAAEIRAAVKVDADGLAAAGACPPGLAVVLVGARSDSATYVNMKKKAAAEAGFHSVTKELPVDVEQAELMRTVQQLNDDPAVDGILVQLPLPGHLDQAAVLESIVVEKDVDGFHPQNMGSMARYGEEMRRSKSGPFDVMKLPINAPCTPLGCIELIKRAGGSLEGQHIVVLGRSNIVGLPAAIMGLHADATVTCCHSKTKGLAGIVRQADVVIAAIGIPEFVQADWIKPGAIVIDVGVNFKDGVGKDGNSRQVMCGDVDFAAVCAQVDDVQITPVPGGVGPMTIAMLLRNTMNNAAQRAITAASLLTAPSLGGADSAKSTFEPGLSDEAIARSHAHTMRPIIELARVKYGAALADALIQYGEHKAKIPLPLLESLTAADPEGREDGKLILVTAMSPTKFGEGKTCTSVGLHDGLCHLGHNSLVALREPSLGPVFGIKGGAAGGGYAQVVPMDDINLHFTGDMHAIGAAHNLLSALVDNHLHWNKEPLLDTNAISWGRVVDMNDRALRNVVVGLGEKKDGVPRQDRFDITVASELMAIFCLSTSIEDLKTRIGQIVVGHTHTKEPVTAADIKGVGAVAALLKDALQPNLVQTLEGNLALVHGGPFANIAHGCNSAIATKTALQLADYVVTEAGFGADLGAEKFFNIKCRKTGLTPSAAVVVCTVRALKAHGGAEAQLEVGMANLERHLSNIGKFGVPSVVALNVFPDDTEAELAHVEKLCSAVGANCVRANHHGQGGAGAAGLAQAVLDICDSRDRDQAAASFQYLYKDELPLREKVELVAKEIYGAGEVSWGPMTLTTLKSLTAQGHGHLPVCMAKNQYSFSADPKATGAPSRHALPVRSVRLAAGAEFIVVLTGDVMTMPGLPKTPGANAIDVDSHGRISGLF